MPTSEDQTGWINVGLTKLYIQTMDTLEGLNVTDCISKPRPLDTLDLLPPFVFTLSTSIAMTIY